MADGRHFENGFIAISRDSPDFNEIWCTDALLCLQGQPRSCSTHTGQRAKFLQIQNGGRPLYWKSFFSSSPKIYCL